MAVYDTHLLNGEHLGHLIGKIKTLVGTKIDNPSQKTDGQILAYDATTGNWLAIDAPSDAVWGEITGTLADQTDLQDALDDKADADDLGTAAALDYTNAVTEDSTDLVTSGAVFDAVKDLTGFHFEIVQTLPATGQPNIIYLVLKEATETGNVYTEYAWINNAWEKLGDTAITLEYLTNNEIDTIWNAN